MSYLEILITDPTDWFQLNMSTFSTISLILGHQKIGTEIYQLFSNYFMKWNRPVQNLHFELCTGIFKS